MNDAEKELAVRAAWGILIDDKYRYSEANAYGAAYDRLRALFGEPEPQITKVNRILME